MQLGISVMQLWGFFTAKVCKILILGTQFKPEEQATVSLLTVPTQTPTSAPLGSCWQYHFNCLLGSCVCIFLWQSCIFRVAAKSWEKLTCLHNAVRKHSFLIRSFCWGGFCTCFFQLLLNEHCFLIKFMPGVLLYPSTGRYKEWFVAQNIPSIKTTRQ